MPLPHPQSPKPGSPALTIVTLVAVGWALGLAVYGIHKYGGARTDVTAHPDTGAPWTVEPESERGFDTVVIGLDADNGRYFDLPYLPQTSSRLREELYWLDFELTHGRVLDALPLDTDLYVGWPRAKFPEQGRGLEPLYFRDYLSKRLGWSAERVGRVHDFEVPVEMPWTQDMATIIGRDADGRRWLLCGPEDNPAYRGAVDALTHAFPDRFAALTLPLGLSAEGGDLALVTGPDRKPLLVLGRHRVLRSLALMGLGDGSGKPVPEADLVRVEQAYADAFGVPVLVLPRRALLGGWGNEDLFHLDMMAAFVADSIGSRALVARVGPDAYDSVAHKALGADYAASLNMELDAAAAQLRGAGFLVTRLPLDDHPVRSPANSVKGLDKDGHRLAILGRYPPLTVFRGRVGLSPMELALRRLLASAAAIHTGKAGWEQALRPSLDAVWAELDSDAKAAATGDDAVSRQYRASGYAVATVAEYPGGAGGFHCQLLH
jgi:hypothetical protein